jgi:hypothetical protein
MEGIRFVEGDFLQTSNFALDVTDVPYIGVGLVPPKQLTMQYLEQPVDGEPSEFPEMDIIHRGHRATPPSPLLCDYLYGVAIYKHWGVGGEFQSLIERYSADHYGLVLAATPPELLSQ